MTPALVEEGPAELAGWLRRLAALVERCGLKVISLDVVAGPGWRSVQVTKGDLGRLPGESRLRRRDSALYPWMRVKDCDGIELYALLRDSEVTTYELATLEGA